METYELEVQTVDGRHVRIERDEPTLGEDGLDCRFDMRIYIDGEQIDATDAAYRHEGNRMVLVTSVGDFELADT